MPIVDLLLIGAVAVFAFAGWRQGFVASVFSFTGFLAGGIGAALVLPDVIEARTDPGLMRTFVVAITVLACALVGQVLASLIGSRLSSAITWHPAVLVDRLLGATLNVTAFAIVMWIVASALTSLPTSGVSQALRQSQALIALDRLVPDRARDAFTSLRDIIGDTAVPRVFAGLAEVTGPDVDPPDPAAVTTPAVDEASRSVVRVTGVARCVTEGEERTADVSGSGFAYAREHILTNAHVVAGVRQPRVAVSGPNGTELLEAVTVAFDPRLDAAVLWVPAWDGAALPWAQRPPTTGEDAVVAGYPGGGALRADPVRVRTVTQARGEAIDGSSGVEREVIAFRGDIEQGNSGGPLLTPGGAVLGMVFGASLGDASTGYAISAAELRDIARSARELREPVGTGTCRR